jgi:hypothetical protein
LEKILSTSEVGPILALIAPSPLSSCEQNSALNKGIGRSPYEALFGKCTTVGLTSETKIPKEILITLENEEDLLKLQNDSLHTQLVAETSSETIADVQEIVYSSTESSAEPSTSVTIEMPKVCSY